MSVQDGRFPWGGLVLALALGGAAWPVQAADEAKAPAPAAGTAEATVVAGPEYEAGPLHQLFLGPHYRDVWTAPIVVPVLDLGSYAGGLTPKKVGGGKQTKSLSFEGKDGREFKFRSVNKDPSATLPKGL